MFKSAYFRGFIMLACVGGLGYGISQIHRMPPPAKKLIGRVGKWLQEQANLPSEAENATQAPAEIASQPLKEPFPFPDLEELDIPFRADNFERQSVVQAGHLENKPTPPKTIPAATSSQAPPAALQVSPETLQKNQLNALAKRLQGLGAVDYKLEEWGSGQKMYRFQCKVAVNPNSGLLQHFEAIDSDGAKAIEKVIAEVLASRRN